jgi:hypothetical protein
MALFRNFGVGRLDFNPPEADPQNIAIFLRFESRARLELAKNLSSVDGHNQTPESLK